MIRQIIGSSRFGETPSTNLGVTAASSTTTPAALALALPAAAAISSVVAAAARAIVATSSSSATSPPAIKTSRIGGRDQESSSYQRITGAILTAFPD